jgi:hypothetical protein
LAFVPGFRYDIFVSYASEYNRNGEVSRFVEEVSALLTNHLGRQFRAENVFFDKEHLGNTTNVAWYRTLEAAASRSALLVPLVAPGYIDSSVCRDESHWFRSGDHLRVGESHGICPVLWWRTSESELATELKAAQTHSFVGQYGQTVNPGSPEWQTGVAEFSLKLANALRSLRRACGGIYIGHSSPQFEALREKLVEEIQQSGYRTMTDVEIANAQLALHFLGGQSLDSLSVIEQSLLLCPGQTIVFLPPDASLAIEELEFLSEIENDLQPERRLFGKMYHRLEKSSPTQLIEYIRDQLSKAREAEIAPTVGIPCDKSDVSAAQDLAARIQAAGVRATCPDFLIYETSIAGRLAKYRNLFLRSEALIYYWGRAEAKSIDGLRARARESKRIFRAEAIFLAPPDQPEKQTLVGPVVIRQSGGQIDPDVETALSKFLGSLGRTTLAP